MRRCAIYTRKSTDEGLDQDFNSLDAQHEACEAFIRSQRHEGWRAVRARFDDGGYSGGSMDRPALTLLMQAVERREIDVVVVYKVDRLTRSLADFAKIVELFDGHGVSFVSVTQQFNTTSSMGRLTLNVLLSFAQFEREVTAERIRDKIAASKKKGMWMGGLPPLGYDIQDRKLVVNRTEAETVRAIFRLYQEVDTVRALRDETIRQGIVTKRRRRRDGTVTGGKPFSRGNLYALLSNPIYAGRVRHQDETFPGQHLAIVDPDNWQKAQAQLAENSAMRRFSTNARTASPLTGLVFDETGDRLCPGHARKNDKYYRYYTSQRLTQRPGARGKGWRLRAEELERTVVGLLIQRLTDRHWLATEVMSGNSCIDAHQSLNDRAAEIVRRLARSELRSQIGLLRELVFRVDLSQASISIELNREMLLGSNGNDHDRASDDLASPLRIHAPLELRRRGQEAKLVITGSTPLARQPDPALCRLVSLSRLWFDQLSNGVVASLREIAARDEIHHAEVGHVIRYAFLAPDIVDAILLGQQPADLTAERLRQWRPFPADWNEQRQALGFAR